MNNIQIFNNPQFGNIRTVTIDGEPWFVGKDIAEALGYTNSKKALGDHVDVEDKQIIQRSQVVTFEIPNRGLIIINESGLYSLILSSKLPNAKKFKRWVTSEVLPSIRKSGHYEAPGYTPKATSIGEVVNLIKITRQTMKEQGATPTDIAKTVKKICEQFGVNLPQCFIKPKETTMADVMQMIDFIYTQPKGKGQKTPTYDDFIIYQASVKRLGG
jgi:prophage antirepressor-like protein